MMKIYAIILSLLLQGVWWNTCAKASEGDLEWKEGVQQVQEGEPDFAFMDFKMIHDDYPKSGHALSAAFSEGEYYFLKDELSLASDAFKNFYTQYPERQESMAALAYLYQIAKMQNHQAQMKEYRAKVVAFRQLTFIFKENKSFKFSSGFQRQYKLVYTIDKVALYVNGKLFTEVPF
jgi:outer membrane protein assembly factor BamD (BamD/ComL family)